MKHTVHIDKVPGTGIYLTCNCGWHDEVIFDDAIDQCIRHHRAQPEKTLAVARTWREGDKLAKHMEARATRHRERYGPFIDLDVAIAEITNPNEIVIADIVGEHWLFKNIEMTVVVWGTPDCVTILSPN